jgi:hypothetical protein
MKLEHLVTKKYFQPVWEEFISIKKISIFEIVFEMLMRLFFIEIF